MKMSNPGRSTFFARLTKSAPSSDDMWRPCFLQKHEATDFDGQLVACSEAGDVMIVTVRGRLGGKVTFPVTQAFSAKLANSQSSSQASRKAVVVSISVSLFESLGLAKDVKDGEIRVAKQEEFDNLCLDEVELSLRDTFVSKRDIWQFQVNVLGGAVFEGHSPPVSSFLNNRSEVFSVHHKTSLLCSPGSGVIGSSTRVGFSSLSAQIVLVMSLSREMWTFSSDGMPLYEEAVSYITKALYGHNTSHYLTFVLSFRLEHQTKTEDFYEVIYEGYMSKLAQVDLVKFLRKFFLSFPDNIGWTAPCFRGEGQSDDRSTKQAKDLTNVALLNDTKKCGLLSESFCSDFPCPAVPTAAESENLFESVNLALDQFALIHVDRKLRCTGVKALVISAGCGVWKTTSELSNLTEARLGLHTTSLSVVCLGSRPLHRVPVLIGERSDFLNSNFLDLHYYPGNNQRQVKKAIAHVKERIRCMQLVSEGVSLLITAASGPQGTLSLPEPWCKKTDEKSLSTVSGSSPPLSPSSPSSVRRPSPTTPVIEATELLGRVPLLRATDTSSFQLPSDATVADTWIVQGERAATFHELIGMRMAFDLQLVDRAYDFGSKVARSILRGKDIKSVVMRGVDGFWVLQLLDAGNIAVTKLRGSHMNDALLNLNYDYWLRRRPIIRVTHTAEETVSTGSSLAPVMTRCVECDKLSRSVFTRRKKIFHTTPSVAWNQLDNIVTDLDPMVPSVIPLSVPRSSHALNWRSRGAIKSNLFVLIPRDLSEITVSQKEAVSGLSKAAISPGSDLWLMPGKTVSSAFYERFLAFLVRLEQLTQIKLNVQLNRRPQVFSGVKVILSAGKSAEGGGSDWLTIHHDDAFMPPRMFMFSVEWLMCHSKFVRRLTHALTTAAEDNSFSLLSLPHALLFPSVAPPALWSDDSREVAFDRPPLTSRFSFRFPEWVRSGGNSFFQRLLIKLIDHLKMLIVTGVANPSNPETEETRESGRIQTSTLFRRNPSWILISKDACFILVVRADKIDWHDNYTLNWLPSPVLVKRYGENLGSAAALELQDDYFLEFRSFLHSTLVECAP